VLRLRRPPFEGFAVAGRAAAVTEITVPAIAVG